MERCLTSRQARRWLTPKIRSSMSTAARRRQRAGLRTSPGRCPSGCLCPTPRRPTGASIACSRLQVPSAVSHRWLPARRTGSTTGDRSPQRHRVGADFRCVGARGEDPIRLVEFPHPLLRGGATYVWSRWSGLSTHYRGPQDSHSTWTTLRGSGHRRLRRLAIRVKTVCLRVRLRFGIITILVLQAHFGPVLLDEVAND